MVKPRVKPWTYCINILFDFGTLGLGPFVCSMITVKKNIFGDSFSPGNRSSVTESINNVVSTGVTVGIPEHVKTRRPYFEVLKLVSTFVRMELGFAGSMFGFTFQYF